MEGIKLIFSLCLLHYSIFTHVNADDGCSDDDLNTMGFLEPNNKVTEQLFKTVHIFKVVGKKYATNTSDTTPYKSYIDKLFLQFEILNVQDKCKDCFAASVMCNVKHCKTSCMTDQCSKSCITCHNKNCKEDLIKCIGGTNRVLLDPCSKKDEFKKYSLPNDPVSPN